MYVVDHKFVMIEVPRMATTFLRGFFSEFTGGTNHMGHMHSPGFLNQFPLPTAITMQDPERWYPSFWRYFVDPPQEIKPNPELVQSHLNVAQGLGFKGWLEKVTLGGPVDFNDPFLLPISPHGSGQGCDSFSHPFWHEKLRRGGGLFSYVFRYMRNRDTKVIRVCKLAEELEKVLWLHDVEISDDARAWLRNTPPINAVEGKPELDDEMRNWIYTAEAEMYDDFRPDQWDAGA